MPSSQQVISVVASVALVVSSMGLDGCKKKESQPGQQAQAPTATFAMPTADQLYQLVAPIALFPDNLVAIVLASSTYPDQITAAWQWMQQNGGLKGPQLMQSVDQQPWDPSVKGLTQFSDVLQQMATNLSWTSSLGDAYFNAPQKRDERRAGDAPESRRPSGRQPEIDPSAERSGRGISPRN